MTATIRLGRRRRPALGVHLALTVTALFVLVPMWGLLVVALEGRIGLFPTEPRLWPAEPTIETFSLAWSEPSNNQTFLLLLRNSLVVSGGAAVVALVFGVSMAYAFARFRFPGRDRAATAILLGALLPPIALLTPLYVLLSVIGIRQTLLGLGVVYAAFSMPLAVWLMRGAFRTLQREVEESAYLDGASAFRTFRSIGLPLVLPSILTAALAAFLLGYSEFAFGWLFVSKASDVTLAMATSASFAGFSRAFGLVAALALMMAVPVVAVFLVLQRLLLRDVTLGQAE